MVEVGRESIAREVTNGGRMAGREMVFKIASEVPTVRAYGDYFWVHRFRDDSAIVETARICDDEIFYRVLDRFTEQGMIVAMEQLKPHIHA